jgi:ubiquinone/menaquinone biosynthesis C-methylase UbiE
LSAPFPPWLTWLLDNPLRALLLAPTTFCDRVPIRPTDRILEIGPGSGFFSVELAKRVPHGHLELLDIQPEMLDKARRKLTAAGVRNVGFTVASGDGPLPFADASFDIAVLITVLGEIPDPAAAVQSLARILKRGGILAIHEHLPDPDIIPQGKLRRLVEPLGFRMESTTGPRWNYTALFRRTSS